MTTSNVTTPLNKLTASEIVAAIGSGRTTCEAVTRACLERIAAREPEVQAWQYLDPDQALAAARACDRSSKRGPLFGVPFNVKDIIDTSDMPTEYGSPIYAGHRPRADAACVALARKAGGVLLGKATTVEFATLHPTKTRNPLDLARTPGGSSSGSAASVADFMVPISIGSQGTSSTVKPASFCGVFGYRPTYGDLRMTGVKEAHGSLDTLGLFARSIDDIALLRDVLLDIVPVPVVRNVPAPRIGFCRTHFWSVLDPSTQDLLGSAAQDLARRGASVSDVTLPKAFEGISDAHHATAGFEFTRNYTWEIENHWEQLSHTLRDGRIKDGQKCTFEQFVEGRTLLEELRQCIAPILENYDVVLTSCATGEAPIGLHSTGSTLPALIWTAMRLPAISMPLFKGPAGMPVAALLVGKRNDDRKLFAVAQWVQQALAGHKG